MNGGHDADDPATAHTRFIPSGIKPDPIHLDSLSWCDVHHNVANSDNLLLAGVSADAWSRDLIFRKEQIETCRFFYVCVTAVTNRFSALKNQGLRGLRNFG
jgi:hypothetical protein